jgi:uncharacterized protein (TIGR01615 family)
LALRQLQGCDACAGKELIVECAFREHFRIPCASDAYSALLAAVPAVFVGTAAAMAPIVELLTHEMARAFADRGLTMPPWRSARSMMSKWAPQRATDRLPHCGALSGRSTSPTAAPLKMADSSRMHDMRASAPAHVRAAPALARGAMAVPTRGDAGALPRTEHATGHSSRSLLGRNQHRPFGGGSPVLSVKVGFEYPRGSSRCDAPA